MEGRLFGRTEAEKQRLNQIKAQALEKCEVERAKLKICFRESWTGWCAEEHSSFWKCFLAEREQLLLQGKGVEVPDHHWSDREKGNS